MAWPLWVVQLIVAVTLQVAAYLLAPKPKTDSSAIQDFESPTADAGRPAPVAFGTVTIKGLNVLHYSDKSKRTYKVKA